MRVLQATQGRLTHCRVAVELEKILHNYRAQTCEHAQSDAEQRLDHVSIRLKLIDTQQAVVISRLVISRNTQPLVIWIKLWI